MLKFLRWSFLGLFFALGAAASLYSLWSCLLAYRAESWPSVPGRIVSDDCRIAGDRTAERYTRYRYVVDSATHINDREYFGLRIASNNCAAEWQSGQIVLVHYAAADPSDSVLRPGDYRAGVFGFLVGLAFMVFAGAACYFETRRSAAFLNPHS